MGRQHGIRRSALERVGPLNSRSSMVETSRSGKIAYSPLRQAILPLLLVSTMLEREMDHALQSASGEWPCWRPESHDIAAP